MREDGRLAGVVSERDLLRSLLPSYITQAESLAGVLEEKAADVLWQRLEGKSVADLLPKDGDVLPDVQGEDTLIEVASMMVRAGTSLVAVWEGERLLGGITVSALLDRLLNP